MTTLRTRTHTLALASALVLAGCGPTGSAPEIDAGLTALEHQVTLLEDAKAIKRLQRAYGYYVDEGMGDRIGDLFSSDPGATAELGGSGVYVGRDRIGEFYTRITPPLVEGQLNNHMQMQGVVHVADDGQSGEGRWRGLIQTGIHGESADWAEGPYENTYIKEDGVWKFQSVHWYATVMAPYDPGWNLAPRTMDGPNEEFPPDRPPSDAYQPYPSAHLAPYHYENPVTGPRRPRTVPSTVASGSLDDAWARLAAIEARTTRLADIDAIEKLQRSYGFYQDKMLWDEVAALFVGDGTMEVGPSGVYQGPDSIRNYLYSLSDGQAGPIEGELYTHMQLQPIVTLSPNGTRANARWRAFMQLGTYGTGSAGTWGEGVYENAYVKENGVWKIASLHFDPTYLAPYEGGWKDASPEMVADYAMGKGVEPDGPPSHDYAAYPEIQVMPFHYGTDPGRYPAPSVQPGSQTGTIEELETALADAAHAVTLLEDVEQIENISGIYGFYVDMSMQDDIADLFNEEGVVEILGRGVFEGIDRVRQYMHNLGPVGPQENGLFNHMHLQPIVDVAPDGLSARVRSRLFVMFGRYPANAQYGSGIYENEFIKEDGVWKIDYLHGYQTFYTLYEDGWARRASAMFSPYPQLPPDRPQSVPYDPYPAAFVPPFHYPNPVSGQAWAP